MITHKASKRKRDFKGRFIKERKNLICRVKTCSRFSYIKGLCNKHYRRWQRYGNPLITKRPMREEGARSIRCTICQKAKSLNQFYTFSTMHCKVCTRKIQNEKNKQLRKEAISIYGGKCDCCGERRFEFLAIDHPNGNGKKDRLKSGRGPGDLPRWLKRNHYPKGYRILCHNCNCALGFYGYCPHQAT